MKWSGFAFVLAFCFPILAQARIAPTWPPVIRPSGPQSATAVLRHLPNQTILPVVQRKPLFEHDQILCLALALYHEARGDTEADRVAVAQVIANRVEHTGASICATIWADRGSQFQWVKDIGAMMPHELPIWRVVQTDAVAFIAHRPTDITRGATLFYNPLLASPPWIKNGAQVTLRLHQVFLVDGSN